MELYTTAHRVDRGPSQQALDHLHKARSRHQHGILANSAVAEMTPHEHEAWILYTTGKYPLSKVDWNSNCGEAPTSPKPLRIVRRRAEALNRLYNTNKADAGHSVWFTKHEIHHLPLVKVMVRIIGAERNLLGGQYTMNATQLADLQTINRILSDSTEILKKSRGHPMSEEISSAQQVLIVQQNTLRETLTKNERKRKAPPQ